jgi:hypothetical protein
LKIFADWATSELLPRCCINTDFVQRSMQALIEASLHLHTEVLDSWSDFERPWGRKRVLSGLPQYINYDLLPTWDGITAGLAGDAKWSAENIREGTHYFAALRCAMEAAGSAEGDWQHWSAARTSAL